ncbi:MAG: YncE family protein [Acidobacteriota bacterium]
MRLSLSLLACLLTLPASAATLVVLDKADDRALLMDPETGRVIATLPTGVGPHEVAISPDGERAVVSNYGRRSPGSSLTILHVGEARVIRQVDLGHDRPHGLVFLEDGRHALSTAEGSEMLLKVDTLTGDVVEALDTGGQVSHQVAWNARRSRAHVANIGTGDVSVVDPHVGALLQVLATGAGAEGIAVTPDGEQVWVSNRSADTVSVVDTGTLDELAELPSGDFPIRVAITPDGRHALVTAARSGDLWVHDVTRRQVLRRIDLSAGDRSQPGQSPTPIGVTCSSDGKRAFVSLSRAGELVEVDLRTFRVVARHAAGREPDGVAWTDVDAHPDLRSDPLMGLSFGRRDLISMWPPEPAISAPTPTREAPLPRVP